MARPLVSPNALRVHVEQLAERHAPIPLDSVDRTVHDPTAVRERYGHVIDYLARVELEVDRNVLELLTLLPGVTDTDRTFFADVWQPQEIQHGLILDRLQQDLGMPAAVPDTTTLSGKVRVLGALSHLHPVHEVVRLLYYLTGAATEKSAVLAYNRLSAGMVELGETAVQRTVVGPIKRQEPGHFAYYQMSATSMVQHGVLAPWQLRLAGILRSRSFGVVGAGSRAQRAAFGGVMVSLGLDDDVDGYARDIAVVEARLLWSQQQGMRVPSYVLAALREALTLHSTAEGNRFVTAA
jgi:hypothetical protein